MYDEDIFKKLFPARFYFFPLAWGNWERSQLQIKIKAKF